LLVVPAFSTFAGIHSSPSPRKLAAHVDLVLDEGLADDCLDAIKIIALKEQASAEDAFEIATNLGGAIGGGRDHGVPTFSIR
jgi:hypothetical protein